MTNSTGFTYWFKFQVQRRSLKNLLILDKEAIVTRGLCDQVNIAWQINKIDGLMQDRGISSALAMETLQFCTKPSK